MSFEKDTLVEGFGKFGNLLDEGDDPNKEKLRMAKKAMERAFDLGAEWVEKDGTPITDEKYLELLAEMKIERGEGGPGVKK